MKLKLKSNIDEIKKECEDRGLSTDGSAKDLKERLKLFEAELKEDLFRTPVNSSAEAESSFSLPENKFLIQLKLANLSMYFVHGFLYPVNLEESTVYKEQNRKSDLLTQYPDHLPLAKGVINDFDETQVLVEVVIPSEQLQDAPRYEQVIFLSGPLPVSRVTAIYFGNNSARTSFLASVDIFPDTFIPKDICRMIPENIATFILAGNSVPASSDNKWSALITSYDQLLGMLAFLKNTSLFFTNASNEFIDYTPGYFQVISLINNQEDASYKENSFFRWIISPESIEIDGKLARYQFKEIIKAVYEGREFDVDWALQLLESSMAIEKSRDVVEQLRAIAKLFFDYKKLRIDYRALLSNPLIQKNIPVMILIFLIKFPNKNLVHSDKQAFKNYFRTNESGIERKDAEYIFAVLGLYYGYSNLVKEDRIEMADPYFNGLAREKANIKFKLDSFFDRFVIESAFEFSKRNGERLNSTFDFLKIAPTPHPVRLPARRSIEAEYVDRSYMKFDKQIISIQKIGANLMIARELPVLYGPHITQEDHLFTYIARHYPQLMRVNTERLAQLIADDPSNKTLAELRDTIELDKKYRSRSKR